MQTYEFEHSVEGSASVEAVWGLWSDVARWTEWDGDLESIELDGPFDAGTRGRMVMPGQPVIEFVLTEVVPGKGFTDETTVQGAVLRFAHEVEAVGAGRVKVTHRLVVEGAAAEEFGPVVAEGLPEAVERLVALASSSG
ncbi:SRPBCC family protein [Saccharothrix variisporea]|uniref:Polyketide cyclase/dehydrase/lipid transport protein n=1 Tax=Saccharothrix variisporea TaxID=543527 RepID=A0A495XCE5_9PSEU|nr:SRPBCC family protein [Saccharothrix variisporea]RKT70795.1 polyketide cyclase/dehydrase/lipid transport protein [Saccharothrix variisporea]